ncbi:MAG: M15 family metallopeptidase [Gammaproteobacteria bacterium]
MQHSIKATRICVIAMLLSYQSLIHATQNNMPSVFKSNIASIPNQIRSQMLEFTWHKGCPVPISDLAYVELSYWGFDEQPHMGALIVNKKLAKEIINIFNILFQHKFAIHQMRPIEEFKGNDLASMRANNTSAFNCREVTGLPGVFSQHSYGRAIDINPLINPFVDGKLVSPQEGAKYLDRTTPAPGKIIKGDIVYQTFKQYGWDWGGAWKDVQDHQHFEKRARGEKRNPHGY